MNGPKKPRAPALTAAASAPAQAVQLADIEIRVVLSFRNLKPETKQAWLEMLEGVAADHQLQLAARRPVPVLRLVGGGTR